MLEAELSGFPLSVFVLTASAVFHALMLILALSYFKNGRKALLIWSGLVVLEILFLSFVYFSGDKVVRTLFLENIVHVPILVGAIGVHTLTFFIARRIFGDWKRAMIVWGSLAGGHVLAVFYLIQYL